MLIRDSSLYHLSQAYVSEEATANLRHQLRNRIGVIRNASFFLRKAFEGSQDAQLRDEAQIHEFFDLIDGQLGDMTRSISDNVVPVDLEGMTSICDIASVIGALTSKLNAPAGLNLQWHLVPAEGDVDPAELQLAVLCLIENAAEAMTAGGDVIVRTSTLPDGRVSISVETNREPISSEVLSRAFEPFFTTKPGHLGLGLNVARRVARRYGGTMELSNREGEGTRALLTIRAPRSDPSAGSVS